MAIVNSPSIVTNGLVFHYDMNNVKSYTSPAIQNLMNQSAPVPTGTGTGTGYSSTGGTEVVNIPNLGIRTVSYNLIQNNYTAISPNSSNCCPCLMQYGNSITVSPSTLYTYAIVYKCDSGYTNANYMYRYEYNSGTYVGESGVFNASNQIHLGSGWYWAWGTFTTAATTNTLINVSAFYYQYANNVDKLSVATALLTPGNYTALPPRLWPAMNTTRSNTQALVDLTGKSTITANSLTYSSNGSFSFSGSNYITVPSSPLFSFAPTGASFTVEAWVYPTSNNNLASIAAVWTQSGSSGGDQWWLGIVSGTLEFSWMPYSDSSGFITAGPSMPINTYAHVALTNVGGTFTMYKNGVSVATGTSTATGGVQAVLSIGSYGSANSYPSTQGFIGQIPSVKIYNRGLSATEITQNFNAQRKIYGV